MIYKLDINDRAFLAIKNKLKKIELRVTTDKNRIDYGNFRVGDTILFNNSHNELLKCLITDINWYKTAEELLILEGTRYTLSSTDDFNEGIKSINNIINYQQGIVENGIYAIHIKIL